MSNIIRIDDAKGVPHFYDFGTKNSSFLLTAQELKSKGIKNWYFMLEVKNPHLGVQDLDPYDPNITPENIGRIHIENKQNPWFFFREVAKVPVRGAGNLPTDLLRASTAAIWCFMHNIDFMLCQPRQTKKSTWLTLIVEYAMLYGVQNVDIPYMHIRQDRCLENAEMLRDYICALPPYINPWYGRTKLPGTKSLKYDEHNTGVAIISSADSEVKAKDKMRGMTLFLSMLDEWEYIPYIASVLEGATPAIISGREIVKNNGGTACMMMASTPGDLETSTGKEAQRIIDQTPRFCEELYDFTDEELQNYFDGVTRPDENGNPQQITSLYIEYDYIQCRKDEKWLREQYNEAVKLNKISEYRRGILLDRFRGGANGSFFEQKDIDFIQEHVRHPDHDVFLMKKYHLYVYDHPIFVPDLNSQTPYFDMSIPYLIGIDCATGKGGDSTAICITHPYTLLPVAELESPWMGGLDLMRVVTILAKMLPRALFCLESNMTGVDIIDFVQESQLENRFYHDPRATEMTKNVIDPIPDSNHISLRKRAEAKRHFGTYVSSKVRDTMFNILRETLRDYRHLVTSQMLVKEITTLVQFKNGKIAADNGEHDDMVMAYLHTRYVLQYGYDLARFGIDKSKCTFSKATKIMADFEKSMDEERVDNTTGLENSTYEAQLLQDMSTHSDSIENVNGHDEYGYTYNQYKPFGSSNGQPLQQTNDVVHSTASSLAFFREVNNF